MPPWQLLWEDQKKSEGCSDWRLSWGIALGIMIVLSHLAIFMQINHVGQMDMPMLGIVNNISPILGFIMAIVIFAMIFNTGLGMFMLLRHVLP